MKLDPKEILFIWGGKDQVIGFSECSSKFSVSTKCGKIIRCLVDNYL
jgi:hypothetical protein